MQGRRLPEDRGRPTSPARQRSTLVVKGTLVSAALVCFGVAAVALAGMREGASVAQAAVYCMAPALGGVAFLGALRLTDEAKVNLLLALFSTGLTLYAAELTLGYYFERSEVGRRAAGGAWDERTRIQVAQDLRRSGAEAFPRLSGWDLRQLVLSIDGQPVQPLAPGIASALVVLCRETGPYVTYTADERGFRNPEGAWLGESDAVILGDSYVHGYCVPESESLAQLLRRRWPTLLNLGVAGTGPLMQLAVLKEYASPVRPRTVIWVYYEGNDLSDLEAEEASSILRSYLRPGFTQQLLRDQEALDARLASRVAGKIAEVGEGARGFSGGRRFATRAREALALPVLRALVGIGARFPRGASSLGPLPAILGEAKRTVAAWGGDLHLVYLPTSGRYNSWLGEAVRGRQELLQTAKELDIPVVDLEPTFRATGEPRDLWVPGGHLRPRGYAMVAERILAEVPR